MGKAFYCLYFIDLLIVLKIYILQFLHIFSYLKSCSKVLFNSLFRITPGRAIKKDCLCNAYSLWGFASISLTFDQILANRLFITVQYKILLHLKMPLNS